MNQLFAVTRDPNLVMSTHHVTNIGKQRKRTVSGGIWSHSVREQVSTMIWPSAEGRQYSKTWHTRSDQLGLDKMLVPSAAIQVLARSRHSFVVVRIFAVGKIHVPVGLLEKVHRRKTQTRKFIRVTSVASAKVFPVEIHALVCDL